MMRIALALLCVLALPASGADYSPFNVERDELMRRVQVIALRPLTFSSDQLENRVAARQIVEDSVSEALTNAGFRVVAPTEFEREWLRISQQLGGTYDRHSGAGRDEAWGLAYDLCFRELAAQHGVDAIAAVDIGEREAQTAINGSGQPFFRGDRIRWRGKWMWARPQRLHASYLSFTLHDSGRANLYGIAAPIEWTEVFANHDRDRRSPGKLLVDRSRLKQAVALALGPLATSPNTGR